MVPEIISVVTNSKLLSPELCSVYLYRSVRYSLVSAVEEVGRALYQVLSRYP